MKYLSLLFIFVLVFYGCNQNKRVNEQYTIVCSTSIIKDCVSEIVGSEFTVKSLMGANVDPHSYNPKFSDIQHLMQANVIIYNGFHLEGKMPSVFQKLKSNHHVFAVSDFFSKEKARKIDQHSYDPHIWFQVSEWIHAMEGIKNELTKIYPDKKDLLEKNFKTWTNKCVRIKNHWKKKLLDIPKNQRTLITSHDAFHYYADEFSINVKALQGVSTVQEANASDMKNLINFISDNHIKALFVESSVNPKTIHTVIRALKLKHKDVKIGGVLYSDALGNKGSGADTYVKMINYNSSQLFNGLK